MMSRQLEAKEEERRRRERDATLYAVYGGLEDAVGRAGGVLRGFSVKLAEGDCLLTLRVEMPGGVFVAFVGHEDLSAALRKAVDQANRDELRLKEDRYGRG
jgi:hypothetical protein